MLFMKMILEDPSISFKVAANKIVVSICRETQTERKIILLTNWNSYIN